MPDYPPDYPNEPRAAGQRGGKRPGAGRRKKPDQRRIQHHLPAGLLETAALRARQEGVTRSEILRRALVAYLK